jgi:hypothetical protein
LPIADGTPFVYKHNEKNVAEIYINQGINFATLTHFANIGLLTFDNFNNFTLNLTSKKLLCNYHQYSCNITFPNDNANDFLTGQVILSLIGREVYNLCQPVMNQEFFDFLLVKWRSSGLIVDVVNPRP